jgi:hypothetical protein
MAFSLISSGFIISSASFAWLFFLKTDQAMLTSQILYTKKPLPVKTERGLQKMQRQKKTILG